MNFSCNSDNSVQDGQNTMTAQRHLTVRNDAVNAGILRFHFRQTAPKYLWTNYTAADPWYRWPAKPKT